MRSDHLPKAVKGEPLEAFSIRFSSRALAPVANADSVAVFRAGRPAVIMIPGASSGEGDDHERIAGAAGVESIEFAPSRRWRNGRPQQRTRGSGVPSLTQEVLQKHADHDHA